MKANLKKKCAWMDLINGTELRGVVLVALVGGPPERKFPARNEGAKLQEAKNAQLRLWELDAEDEPIALMLCTGRW